MQRSVTCNVTQSGQQALPKVAPEATESCSLQAALLGMLAWRHNRCLCHKAACCCQQHIDRSCPVCSHNPHAHRFSTSARNSSSVRVLIPSLAASAFFFVAEDLPGTPLEPICVGNRGAVVVVACVFECCRMSGTVLAVEREDVCGEGLGHCRVSIRPFATAHDAHHPTHADIAAAS